MTTSGDIGVLYTNQPSKAIDQLLETKSHLNSGSSSRKSKQILIISVVVIILITVTAILIFGVYYDEIFGEAGESLAGPIGQWPMYGGNLANQQTPANPESILINKENIGTMYSHCEYESEYGIGTLGFPTIDDEYNAYFTDLSGFITKYDIENCQQIWRVNVANILGYDGDETIVGTHQSITLFQDKLGRRGALFSAPSRRPYPSGGWSFLTYPPKAPCFAIALNMFDGSVLWQVEVAPAININSNWRCNIHGFFVDGDYAYGGLAQSGNHFNESQIIGRMLKINIGLKEPRIVDTWYPFDPQLTEPQLQDQERWSYLGAGSYNFPAIIDDYLIFGTGQLYRTPKYIDNCLSGDFQQLALEDSVSHNVCGERKENDRFWRCLEKNVYTDSLIILNKNTFQMTAAIPMQGVDVYYYSNCWDDENYCYLEMNCYCPSLGNQGPNADVAAVATFRYNGKLYAAASQKPSQLLVVEIPSGKLVVSKSFGPWTNGANFNMAIDEKSGIGILTTRGASKYQLNSGVRFCGGSISSVHAINLLTGITIWQAGNPYGGQRINDSSCWDDDIFPLDRAMEQACEFGEFVENGDNEWNDIIVADIFNPNNITNPDGNEFPLSASSRAGFTSPVTIVNDMVFIPGTSGDIWVHNLYDGGFIANFQCPTVETENGLFNRYGFKGGVSVIDKYIIYYCGDYGGGSTRNGNILAVQKLDVMQ